MSMKQHIETNYLDLNNDYYDQNAQAFFDNTVNVDMSKLYEPFIKLIPCQSCILDAGCGSGRDSLYFLQNGFNVVAFDSSIKIVDLASNYTGLNVLHASFETITFENKFDAIWACASLLHLPKIEINDSLNNLFKALKAGGVLYTSFKYGNKEEVISGRFFNYYDESSFKSLITKFKNVSIIKMWITADVRKERQNEHWLNVLIQLS